jgi:hypothetical protein
MKKRDIYIILSALNKEELVEFSKLLRSPYFNNQSTIIKLFDYILPYYPDFNSPELDDIKLFHVLNPGKKYNDTVFRKYLSDLTRLAETFLIVNGHKKDKDGDALVLLEEYYRRRINVRYEKTLKRIEKQMQNKSEIGENIYLSKHMLEEIKINFEVMNEHFPLDIKLLYNTQFYMFNYFVMLTINNLIELLNYIPAKKLLEENNVVVSFIRNFDFSKFINELSHIPEEQLLTVKLNYLNIMLVLKPEERKYYFEMKELLRKNTEFFSVDSLYIYFTKLNNYCIQLLYSGDDSIITEIFDNLDFALHNKKYLEKIKLNFSFAEYRNALFYSLELGKLDWAKWLVDTFTGYVRHEKRKNLIHYAEAFLLFEKKDYENSLAALSHVEIIKPVIRFDIDLLLTKLYYELEYYDACFSLTDSFAHLVQHSSLFNDNIKKQYHNYLKFYKKLLDVKCGQKKHDAKELYHEITKEKLIKSSRWLLQKVNEINKPVH